MSRPLPRHRRARRVRAVAVAVAVAAAAVVSACGGGSSSSGSNTQAPLKIGMSLPLTGPVADVSKSGYEGYKLWASEVNAGGGILGRQVKLHVLDDGFEPNQNASNYTRLISQEKVDLLLGTFSSLLNAPASAVAARQGMLYVEPSGGAPTLFTRGFKNLFFAQPGTSSTLPDQFVAYIASLPDAQRPKTAAYVTQDDPSASVAVEVFKKKLAAMGIRTLYDQTYDPSTSNFDPIAASIARKAPELVVQGAVAGDGAQFVRSLQKVSFNPKILFQTNSPADETYAAAIGGKSNADGIFTALAWSPEAKYAGNAEFVAAYTKAYGHAPSEDAANSYTAGQVLAAALKAVGKVDHSALAAWLHSHSVDTIVGPLKWDATGVPEGSLLLAQWQNGALRILAPKHAATTTTVVDPKPAWGRG